ncbi:glycoside hydrolase family 3 N-terminal domain-containing protein [[Mycobacterium] wendilense]|uniref:beta-N-acetylhexosaminidase n=1 Tax=[Mycobacterium] wendilense TaxID=3064284 RepID=A0ABN9P8B4_9MYCO|nr:glycoside hydrolase family 3 N-terminal domain-containing protein [Mycolicibacterium sp. MU0050]CAJ1586338.1 glycoside hydrolase family 3 N-terminal domain-containing protein [Mycolicibacterium sp. MU0050]
MAFTSTLGRVAVSVATLPALLLACAPASQQAAPATSEARAQSSPASVPLSNPMPQAPAVCGDLSTLSTRDKLAQLLMVGVSNGADARAVVSDHRVGGIFIGSWTDKSMLTDGTLAQIAAAAEPLPLAVSTDEEGGRVQRLSALIGSQPSPRVLAATKTPDEVYAIARDRGQKMRGLGITVDFAPVVDVTDAADGTVIGDRSFGSDPAVVTEYAGAYARGLRDGGVLPVLKHFPGHGSASGDSHDTGVTTPSLDQLQAVDLVPYRELTAQGPVGVMMGHMQVPGLTGADPASLSGAAVGLLRSGNYGGPGFGGVVFSDDLSSMGAINQRYGVPEAVLRSLQAGVDVALWVSTAEVPAVLDRLESAVASGELSLPAVEASLHRVAGIKGPARC